VVLNEYTVKIKFFVWTLIDLETSMEHVYCTKGSLFWKKKRFFGLL